MSDQARPHETSWNETSSHQDASQPAAALPSGEDESVRVGSPFAVDPLPPQTVRPATQPETLAGWGPAGYTAMGAVLAAGLVLGFAAIAAWWFPAGATLIAALGCVLAIFGLFSAYRWTAAVLLAVHLSLFLYSYLEVVR